MDPESRVVANLRRLREERGLSQEALAHRAGVTVRHIGRIERREGSPTVSVLVKIAMALDVDIAVLFE